MAPKWQATLSLWNRIGQAGASKTLYLAAAKPRLVAVEAVAAGIETVYTDIAGVVEELIDELEDDLVEEFLPQEGLGVSSTKCKHSW